MHLGVGPDALNNVEVDSAAEVDRATILLSNAEAWTARLMDQAILKLKTAIHRSVQVSLINPHKPIIPRK